MKFSRSAGIILHPSSLPGPDGIGDLGPEAYRWVNFLAETGCSLWQVLPLGPTGYGDSPYQCFSAFAGNPYLISPALLLEQGLLTRADLADRPQFLDDTVEYGRVIFWKLTLLDRAYDHFQNKGSDSLKKAFEAYQTANKSWLEDFVLFMAIKESQGGVAWNNWPEGLRTRQPAALTVFSEKFADSIRRHAFRQFLFDQQWQALKKYANAKDIQVIGDIPIFVAYDSSDAWAHPDLFFMDKAGNPTVVAGVPPDYFSPTGQLWGNPLYNWEIHKNTGYTWWIERVKSALKLYDILRMDHFRGFAGYWEVPAGKPTAEEGRWVPGPGADLFEAIEKALGNLPIIAEDLGEITPDVNALRDQFGLPGMKILQFAFSEDATDPFLPHNYIVNCVAYSGTHDNDTSQGWYQNATEKEKDLCRRYLARSGDDIAWDLIRAVWSSVAVFSIAPMQDLLNLGSEARMNFPGKLGGNWSWRVASSALNDTLLGRVKELNALYRRAASFKTQPEKRHK
jgi:4-alpha-glucanotransferase